MGRKKSKRTKPKSRRLVQEKRFNCPLCSQEQAVKCAVDHQKNMGYAECTICDAKYQCATNKLDQAIDVYSSWIDERDEQNGE